MSIQCRSARSASSRCAAFALTRRSTTCSRRTTSGAPSIRDRFEAALTEVVHRHDALRARFELVDGNALQTVDAVAGDILETDDLTALLADRRLEAARALAADDAAQAFDLADGPLFKARLAIIGAEEHLLVLTAHHIVCDGWSMSVIERELGALYGGRSLPDLSLQASDVASWERSRVPERKSDLRWWSDQLEGVKPLVLPRAEPAGATFSEKGGHHSFTLSSQATSRMLELARDREGHALQRSTRGF